jgi:hypothetical protein
MIALARQYGRYGYRRIAALLRDAGYEATHQLILDAKDIDLRGWIETARPFGSAFARVVPKPSLEWRSDGLGCSEWQRPEWSTVGPICELVGNPREIWHLEKRLYLDRVVTLAIFENEKLIWLSEANW